MDTPPVTIVLPTVTGREEICAKAINSYEETCPGVEILVYKDLPVCGAAWVKGADAASREFIWFAADDVYTHPGWWQSTIKVLERGFLPAARILNGDGTLQSCGNWEVEMQDGAIPEFSRSPFITKKMWERFRSLSGLVQFLDIAHYYTDDAISWAARYCGYEIVVHRRFLLTHDMSDVKRGAGMTWQERMNHDFELFRAMLAGRLGTAVVGGL